MRSSEFYQGHLDAVSRSFALCIPQLDQPFRERVALSYLLLRVLDTVEDAPFADRELQQRQFDAFRSFLRAPPTRAQVEAFRASFGGGLTEGERQLLADTEAFLDDAHKLPPTAREVIFSAIDRMAQGMAAYARRPLPLRLTDLEDVCRYCCFVAGLVGELLTRLWSLDGKGKPPAIRHAYRFGLFLQKVNIIKDQADDEAAGRSFVPDRRELLASLRGDAEGALAYLTSLPADDRGYRTFCAWSLMLGASTLSQIAAHRPGDRGEALVLLARTREIVADNDALRQLFSELMPALPAVAPRPPLEKPESAEWFIDVLDAPMSIDSLADLGAVEPPRRKLAASQ